MHILMYMCGKAACLGFRAEHVTNYLGSDVMTDLFRSRLSLAHDDVSLRLCRVAGLSG